MNTCEQFYPLPDNYASNADAWAEYLCARDSGFDGNYNEFLEMEQHRIDLDQAGRALDSAVASYLKIGELNACRSHLAKKLDEVS